MMRLFRRAVVRAGLPVSYSQGFNPHARISAPLPRPVGMASQAELVMVWMTEPVELDAALERLAGGGIVNANAVMTLQWLALNRARLKKLWR